MKKISQLFSKYRFHLLVAINVIVNIIIFYVTYISFSDNQTPYSDEYFTYQIAFTIIILIHAGTLFKLYSKKYAFWNIVAISWLLNIITAMISMYCSMLGVFASLFESISELSI